MSLRRAKDKAKAKLGRGESDISGSVGRSVDGGARSRSEPCADGNARSRALPTPEATQLANDPNFVVEFAIGDPFPELIPQNPGDLDSQIRLTGVYFRENKRFLFKKAHFSHEDRRVFDVESGHVLLASHHEGKNPYEEIDPLGFNESATGEWKSRTTVTSVSDHRYPSFKIRPKTLSRHGYQYVDLIGDDLDEVMAVGKMGKFSSKSMRPHFVVGRGKAKGKGDNMVYKIVGDVLGRTLSVENKRGEVIAVMAKTTKALIKTAVFGSGSESTVDVAPGVDCSTILAIIFAVHQVGAHYLKDCFANFVQDPIQDAAVESAAGAATGGIIGDSGALGEMAGDVGDVADAVGLGDELDAAGDAAGDFLEGAADLAGDVSEGVGLDDLADGAMDAAGDAVGFFYDLFGGD